MEVGMREMSLGQKRQQIPTPQPRSMMGTAVPSMEQNPYLSQVCDVCQEPFTVGVPMMNYKGKAYHAECFVCEQCFR